MRSETLLAMIEGIQRRRQEMLDFTDGTVWFLCGFSVTVAVAVLCGVVAALGERRNTPRRV
jgi:hypothetical protein